MVQTIEFPLPEEDLDIRVQHGPKPVYIYVRHLPTGIATTGTDPESPNRAKKAAIAALEDKIRKRARKIVKVWVGHEGGWQEVPFEYGWYTIEGRFFIYLGKI